ncbi:MAG: hypothetical protein KIS66_03490 [Fimbriimonadaceae bacterium]|nr:hypothetical protein [Fimbriimonadaceae bacterium]
MTEARAGHAGPDVRADCLVTVRYDDQARFAFESPVAALYRGQTEVLARNALARLGASGCSVEVVDAGALPFTIVARLEAAVRRMGRARSAALPTGPSPLTLDEVRARRLRTRLYLPGDTPKFFPNACLYGADALILDLEDSVATPDKDQARILVREALRTLDFGESLRTVRIDGVEDVGALAGSPVDLFFVPKCEDVRDVLAVVELAPNTAVVPILESALAVQRAYEIASAHPNVVALALGAEDYRKDLGVDRSPDGAELAWALGALVNAARAAGVAPLGSVFAGIDDDAGFEASCRAMRAQGFVGVACLHPRQVGLAHRAFAPTEAELERARRVVAAFEASPGGAIAVDGRMVDLPIYQRAKSTLREAGE